MNVEPDYIQFYPTLRCNKSCSFCFNKNMPSMPDMPLREFRAMLGILNHIGVRTIDIIGGEPTLHQDIVGMVCESEQNGFSVNLSSNGTDLESLAEIIKSTKHTTVGISVNNANDLAPVKNFIARNRPVVKSIFQKDMDFGLIKEILALKPERFYLLYRDVMQSQELSKAVPFHLFLLSVKNKFGPDTVETVYCSGFLPDTEHYPDLAHVRCPAGTTKLGVMSDGSVYPCNLLFSNKELRLGNIFLDPFEKIWNHPLLSFFRKFSRNACPRTSCELHSRCHGGCPAHSLVHHGDLAAPDPRCCGTGSRIR